MHISLLGHASLVVEAAGTTLFMDPVFGDPFQGGLVVSCPQRMVDFPALPRPDVLVLSHGHLDHVHHPSLTRLPKTIPVYLPRDAALYTTLLGLGFRNLQPQAPWDTVNVGGIQCTFTPSAGPAVEMGVLWQHNGTSVWNQVDTVITQQACARVAQLTGNALDLAFCGFRPLLEYAGMWVEEDTFPHGRYHRMLEMALCTGARVLVPGSSGLRAVDALDWVNHRLFPGTRQGFVQDLGRLAPEQQTLMMDPGDQLVLEGRNPPAARPSGYAHTLARDEDRVAFAPHSHPAPSMVDHNPRGFSEDTMRAVITPLLEKTLNTVLGGALVPGLTGPLRTLWNRRAILQMEVFFPSGKKAWHIPAWSPKPTVVAGEHPEPDYTWRYLASDLHTLVQGQWVQPTVQAVRRKHRVEGRLDTLEPGRLHGVDIYHVVDETFEWNPLALLV
jgi:L-ascorbate metabolism protein UlaG (beta-lactamase superfamily)